MKTTIALALLLCWGPREWPVAKERPAGNSGTGGRLRVVAAENFWGSIAAQLGGDRVAVTSIIVNPDTDPHCYEPTAADARTLAGSQMAIVNGIGYDNWASKLLAANPLERRGQCSTSARCSGSTRATTRTSGTRRPASSGWSPRSSPTTTRLDPRDAAYFAQRRRDFETVGSRATTALRSEIRARYAGVPVGYSESIFQPARRRPRPKLLTPYSFAKAIAEGTDVSAAGQADRRPPGGDGGSRCGSTTART